MRYKVGSENVMVGYQAGRVFTGDSSVGVGYYALRLLESGEDNTGIGFRALGNNLTNASDNTALGANAGYYVGGSQNTAIGSEALYGSTANTSSRNTAIGYRSLFSNSSGHYNVTQLVGNQWLIIQQV